MIKSYILLILAMLFFSGNFIAGKGFADTIPPFTLALFRATLGFLFLLPLCYKDLFSHYSLWKKEWKPLLYIALTGIVFFNLCMYSSLHYTTATNSAIVDALTPTVAAVIGFFWLKERITWGQSLGILISFIGVLFVISRGSFQLLLSLQFNIGDIIMLVGVIFWAVYSIIIKQHGHKFPRMSGLAVTMLMGVIILLPFSVYELITGGGIVFTPTAIGGLLYIGLFPSAIALLFWYRAVEDIGPAKASMFFNLVPFFTAGLAILLLGEEIFLSQIVGAILIISGVYLATRQHIKSMTEIKEKAL